MEKKIRVFVEENIKLKSKYEKLQDASIKQRDDYNSVKAKFNTLKLKNDELLKDNRTLSRAYQEQKAYKDEQIAKENAIKGKGFDKIFFSFDGTKRNFEGAPLSNN